MYSLYINGCFCGHFDNSGEAIQAGVNSQNFSYVNRWEVRAPSGLIARFMRKAQISIGGRYGAKVSGNKVVVEILREHPYGGWVARNINTGREVRILTAGRLSLLNSENNN